MAGQPLPVNRIVPGLAQQVGIDQPTAPTSQQTGASGAGFPDLLSKMLASVDALQDEAAQLQQSFLAGEPVELHQVMIKAEEAGVAMDLLLEIRNRLVDAYSELMRMPM